MLDSGHPVSHGSDHGASESVYLTDPDGNGLELYWDRPLDEWPRTPDGELALVNLPLELDALLGSSADDEALGLVGRARDQVGDLGGGWRQRPST